MKSILAAIGLLSGILMIPGQSAAQATGKIIENTKSNKDMPIIQQNKEVIRTLYEQSLNRRDMGLLQHLISEDYTGPDGKRGVPGFTEPVEAVIRAFPDVQWKIEELIAEGDKVVIRWTLTGTHNGRFQDIAATGKTVTGNAMAVYELKEGKVISTRVLTDRLGFLQQLDVLPALIVPPKGTKDQVRFIDKFFVPLNAKQEFLERVGINRNLIKKLAGFVDDAAYERTDGQGNLVYITMAIWENNDALMKAKEAVQEAYKKEGFIPAEMFERLHITMDRGIYKEDMP
jgi:predicted ester cyclase